MEGYAALFVIGAFKICTLLVGLALAYMGYRLFLAGVFERAGDLKAAWGDKDLVVKQAAPGTFFALFGTVIISIGVWNGIDLQINGRLPDGGHQADGAGGNKPHEFEVSKGKGEPSRDKDKDKDKK